ncbi:MAG: DUF4126 domain-containing protein [Deltaproteobacteria bacterium]|nr:DUF4126 domain-containing protein [Candidatus Anaeroferrophillus wilburensis]MBN2890058.1 DUF4126 domain-containing protein [Deltaproteobacteria bacterium]
MDLVNSLGILLGSSWGSGVNLYLTTAALGIAHRLEWISLPGNLETLSQPPVIFLAIMLYLVEFIADKIPYIDSLWDSVHTLIRPIGGAVLGYLAMGDYGPLAQIPAALTTGSIALDSHLTKATTRAAINTSPEPFTNAIASVAEDVSVGGILFLMVTYPAITILLVALFLLFSFWFLKKMVRFIKAVFHPSRKRPPVDLQLSSS